MMKKAFAAMALAGMALSAQASVVINEGFDDVSKLNGWILFNASTPLGDTGWYQGDQNVFGAQAGSQDNSYIAANYNNAAPGGTLANWLITPEFDASGDVTVKFWLRADPLDGYSDNIAFGFNGGGGLPINFSMSQPITAPTDGWTEYTAYLHGMGTGATARFAIEYLGDADTSNYVGVDSLSVTVPEPTSALLFAAGMLGLRTVRRRQRG